MTVSKPPVSNFIRSEIEADLAAGRYARIRTRFPPEPNGYLHFGHAKSICLNFGLARDYGGVCHLRFDDTNPEKEEQEYVEAIIEAVRWLGFDWGPHLYYASNYFPQMYAFAEKLIEAGLAYIDSQSPEEIRINRGTLTEPGKNSPYRERTPQESLELFRRMRAGEFPEGAHVLRAKIDMASPNLNLRDPVLYRIKHARHHNTGDAWCIYPMYTYAHPIEDALEGITHSICTLEFEDQRPFYDWLLENLADLGCVTRPLPRQIEFARLNLSHVVLSKRKLIQLVEGGHVSGWDDPRMPTLLAARRRGYAPEGFHRFAEMIGVAKADAVIDYGVFEACQRDVLNEISPRRIAVLDPLRLIIDNYPEAAHEECLAPNHPQKPDWGKRRLPFSRELWIEREDYQENPPAGYFRLFPGNRVRLRYGYVIECLGAEKDEKGRILAVHARYFPDSKSGTPGADAYKVKGNIHWLCARSAQRATVRLFDRLFSVPNPGAERDFLLDLNPQSLTSFSAFVEPELAAAQAEQRFQFERHGYFVVDAKDSTPGAPVFNRTVTLKESWK
ncbi:MAG: glutamine--tRNA ligase/YqeY domain fusion protein [Rhodocyclaceae bacterium]|nr:glutamine--tRNA ligase/YqeY domain fusion protein [Rhodocyclaceae bacterium]